MHKDSIEWTAFICPNPIGHLKWTVMPLGLKNAPAVFRKRMDKIFEKFTDFITVYIDDILIFSKTAKDHNRHLKQVFKKFEENGLIISKKKIELKKTKINFLGVIIGEGQIELQPLITTKILDFPENIKEKKQLQQFLGLLNYARPFIKDLSKYLKPLYLKTGREMFEKLNYKDHEIRR